MQYKSVSVKMKTIVLTLLVYAQLSSSEDNEGIFTSNVDLQRLLQTEEQIVRELHEYIHEEELRLSKLKL